MAGPRIKDDQQPPPKEQEQPKVEAVTNTTMPTDLVPGQEEFELAGFSFGQIIGTEYSDVQIPHGWRRVSVGDFKVDIYDETGRLRAEVREKTSTLLPRYRIAEVTDQPGIVTWMVTDGETVLYSASSSADDFASQDQQFEMVSKWLQIKYSRAADPAAYW